MAECLVVLDRVAVRAQYAGGELPSVATYGVPATWPHVRELYLRSGFVHDGHIELIFVAEVDRLPRRLRRRSTG